MCRKVGYLSYTLQLQLQIIVRIAARVGISISLDTASPETLVSSCAVACSAVHNLSTPKEENLGRMLWMSGSTNSRSPIEVPRVACSGGSAVVVLGSLSSS